MALTKKQVRQLRAMANQLKPLVQIGKGDLSDNVIKQADETIEKRELIKVQVLDGSGIDAKEAAQGLADRMGAGSPGDRQPCRALPSFTSRRHRAHPACARIERMQSLYG